MAKPAREKFLAQSPGGKFWGTEISSKLSVGENFGWWMEGRMCENGSSYTYTAEERGVQVGFVCWITRSPEMVFSLRSEKIVGRLPII